MTHQSPAPDLIADGLWQAYAETLFVYRDGDAIGILRVGHCPDPVTESLFQRAGVSSAVFITAYNAQHGSDQMPELNLQRQNALREELKAEGLSYHAGAGLGGSPEWDPEASLFVLGVTQEQACRLGRRFGQNAVVWVEANREVRLIMSH